MESGKEENADWSSIMCERKIDKSWNGYKFSVPTAAEEEKEGERRLWGCGRYRMI